MKSGGKVFFLVLFMTLNILYLPPWFRGVLRSDLRFIFTCTAMAGFFSLII